ncbi:hypothetical protein A3744_24365, partial [Oleiphilus sp. HI0073]
PPVLGSPNGSQGNAPQAHPPYDDEIDLLELWRALMRGKWIIVGFTAVFSVASVFYALSLPNMYKSTAILAPAEASSSGLAKIAGQFGGLASIAGINLGGGGSNKTAEALEILQSWAFIEEFIQEQNIAPQVFAVKGWNPETNELIYNTEIYDPKTKVWKREPPKGKQAEPSSWELYEVFDLYLSAKDDPGKGFVTVDVEYYSPEVARQWVSGLVSKINAKLKKQAAEEAEANITFLKAQIEQTNLSSMQSVFYDLIEEQTKTLMLASGTRDYVFREVSAPRIAEKKSKPNRALICIMGALFGGMFGVVMGFVYGTKKNRNNKQKDKQV